MDKLVRDNYLNNYQKVLFNSEAQSIQNSEHNSELSKAQSSRRCNAVLSLAVANSSSIGRLAGNILIQPELKNYSKTVDKLDGLNNYANMINIANNNKKIECPKSWKSNLRSKIHTYQNKIPMSSHETPIKSNEINLLQQSIKQDQPPEDQQRYFAGKNNYPSNNLYKSTETKTNSPQIITARQDLINQQHLNNGRGTRNQPTENSRGFVPKKSLGMTPRTSNINNQFVPPTGVPAEDQKQQGSSMQEDAEIDPRLKNIDPKMIELIRSEIMDNGTAITWDDIAGLEFAKKTIQEIVIWPLLRPDIFTGLRRPPKGILLFGPPGTGKTLIGKCIASQSQSTFFSISASSLTSKWIGDGEKMVRALFAVARCHQPAVIFIDEIDSILTQRSDTEHESSRRMKTEFLVQLDGAATAEEDRILIVGATNRPQELDEAARRRLVKRLYIPLPDKTARKQLVNRLMTNERNELSEIDIESIGTLTDGYSGADVKNLCAEASLGPIRSIHFSMMQNINAEQVRPICFEDFQTALNRVRASVSSQDLEQYIVWDKTYGSGAY